MLESEKENILSEKEFLQAERETALSEKGSSLEQVQTLQTEKENLLREKQEVSFKPICAGAQWCLFICLSALDQKMKTWFEEKSVCTTMKGNTCNIMKLSSATQQIR